MTDDFRLKTGFLTHPKIKKLRRRLGADAVLSLVQLYDFTTQNKPRGNLDGMDYEDIELAAAWEGEIGQFVSTLQELRLLDIDEHGFRIHDWQEHNSYAYHKPERIIRAKKGAEAKWKKHKESQEDNATSNATSRQEALLDKRNSNAPSPTPSPSPTPLVGPEQSSEPAFDEIEIPLKNEKPFAVDLEYYTHLVDLYPGISVRRELLRCAEWNRNNPKKRKTEAGIKQHISTWLNRAGNNSSSGFSHISDALPPIPKTEFDDQDRLWQDQLKAQRELKRAERHKKLQEKANET